MELEIDITDNKTKFRLGIGSTVALGTVPLELPFGIVKFHIVPVPTTFLLCLKDMDRLGIYYKNTNDMLIQKERKFPVIRQWGHPWVLRKNEHVNIDQCGQYITGNITGNTTPAGPDIFLTTDELKVLHRRFGHPSVDKLHRILQRAEQRDFKYEEIEAINKMCQHCERNGKAPEGFNLTIMDDKKCHYWTSNR
ncbi:hypothetical protein EAF00_007330 [Botryotinia globosa]|nr:hypothetical protein EAF00_007330 [Botryotinia globosa]